MAKVTQTQNGDSGLVARMNWNEAIKTVEVDGTTITGDGTVGNPLVASGGGGIPEAPNDGKQYGRQNEAWTEVSATTADNLSEGETITFDNDKTSSEQWSGNSIVLSDSDFKNGKVARINHISSAEPSIDFGGLTIVESVKGSYIETTPATANVYTFISRTIDSIKSVEVIIENYLPNSSSDKYIEIKTISDTSYTLVAEDDSSYLRFTSALDVTITIPPNASLSFPTGTAITMRQAGAGQLELAEGTGVTLNGELKTAAQNANIQIIKVGTDVWDVIGGIA